MPCRASLPHPFRSRVAANGHRSGQRSLNSVGARCIGSKRDEEDHGVAALIADRGGLRRRTDWHGWNRQRHPAGAGADPQRLRPEHDCYGTTAPRPSPSPPLPSPPLPFPPLPFPCGALGQARVINETLAVAAVNDTLAFAGSVLGRNTTKVPNDDNVWGADVDSDGDAPVYL